MFEGQQGGKVRIAAKAAHAGMNPPQHVGAGVGVDPAGAGQLVAAEGTELGDVTVVDAVEPGLDGRELAVGPRAGLGVEELGHRVAQLGQGPQFGQGGLGRVDGLELPSDHPSEAVLAGGHDGAFLADPPAEAARVVCSG